MQSNKNERDKKQPAFLQAVFIFMLIFGILLAAFKFKLYRCPAEYLFGIPCPFCGISRALRSLLSGDIRAAFYYHPLWPVILLSLILYLLYALHIIRPGKRIFNAYCIVLAILLCGCFILRHIYGSPVVAVHFDESAAGRFLAFLRML
ncbi:MAG: DUF2752 domain-containing protein [Lachnospiraceae bacterium]|nr:DUF2752 domain-containing protein [Lachnospiraceae bacterium]